MSVRTVAGKFMELCNQGKHFEFMRTFYAPEMVSVEGDGREFVGKEPVIHKSEVFQGNNDIHSQDLRGPFFCGDADASSGRFAVYTSIEFSPKAGRGGGRGGLRGAASASSTKRSACTRSRTTSSRARNSSTSGRSSDR